jgi:hypothetical protein
MFKVTKESHHRFLIAPFTIVGNELFFTDVPGIMTAINQRNEKTKGKNPESPFKSAAGRR